MFPLENSENSVHQSCCSKENVFTQSIFDDYLIILSAISDPLEIRKRLTYDLCLECDLKCFGLVLAKSQKNWFGGTGHSITPGGHREVTQDPRNTP